MMKEYTVLPVRFGIVAQSRGALNNGIKLNLPIIRANLQKVNRKRELNLKSFWENSFIYEHILEKYTEIRKFRDRIKNLRGTQGHYKRIELGQMVERALIIENENEAESIIEEISPAFLQYKKSKIFGELMFLNLSVLVNDKTEPHLDQLVNKAAEKRKGKVQFKYTGPSPPASFVNIHLKFQGVNIIVLRFVTWIAEKVSEAVDKEYYNPEAIQRELMNLSMKLDEGEISEEDYNKREAELLDRLSESQSEEE